jgi:hypothetical protein
MRANTGTQVFLSVSAIAMTGIWATACSANGARTNGGTGGDSTADLGSSGGAGGSITITLSGAGGDGGITTAPTMDGKFCHVDPLGTPGLVCFGTDPYPYQKYLLPSDAGIAPGECPTPDNFPPPPGEDSCGNYACGPLLPSAAEGLQQEGDASVEGSTDACCFLIYFACQG